MLQEAKLKADTSKIMQSTHILHVLVCPNAFKGSLSAVEAAQAIEAGLRHGQGMLKLEITRLPLADGGDGTLETLIAVMGGEEHRQHVQGPRGETVQARWGRLGNTRRETAIIEMAEAAGLRLLTPSQYDPRVTSTFGVGQLMLEAIQAGCRTLILGIGGSATNDGGAGMAHALGARFWDENGNELPPGGAALSRLSRIGMRDWLLPDNVEVIVACDVDNPLCGPEGASAIYGPQKGASAETVQELDEALANYADVLEASLGKNIRNVPGAGAAGGLGAGLMAFCNARLLSGTDMVMETTEFEARLAAADLVITGEGRLDGQTTRGKVIAGVAQRAKMRGVPAIALAGSVDTNAEEELRALGLTVALSIVPQPLPLEIAMREGYGLLSATAERLAQLLSIGASV